MKRNVLLLILIIFVAQIKSNAQTSVDTSYSKNTAQMMLEKDARLTIGGYAQIDYNQPLSKDTRQNGALDVHRLVMLFGYKFDKNTQFITEIEYEHVSEVYVEQAFLQHKFNNFFNLRAGLMLVPMGIINEYHEPPTYRGVERPNLDKYIVPSTWRELGAGFSGRIDALSLRYQAYLFNGFKSFDGAGKLDGQNGLRSGRQKGAKSFSSAPNFSTKLDFYGVSALKLGLAAYVGNTQSTAFDNVRRDDETTLVSADSTVVGLSMLGLDARYNKSGFLLRGQVNLVSLSNTDQYNEYTGKDLGSRLTGYYVEVGYNVFHKVKGKTAELIPFVRYEQYNTHQKTEGFEANLAYNRTEITMGLDWKMTPGSVLKVDYQLFKNGASDGFQGQLNMGVGAWFN